jgi:hypothetical protein
MSDIMERVHKGKRFNTLDHIWASRNLLCCYEDFKLTEKEKKELTNYATAAFKYYSKHKGNFDKDLSLKTVTSLCNCEKLAEDISFRDNDVAYLSKKFNDMIDSDRKLHRCYDCGTTARAMFLSLIKANRGSYDSIRPEEVKLIKSMYYSRDDKPVKYMNDCRKKVLSVDKDTVFLCSTGFTLFGHVWIIEKKMIDDRWRVHHYQSCLNSHLILDYVQDKGYGENLHQSLDVNDFFDRLALLLGNRNSWTDETKQQHADLFKFLPFGDVVDPKPSFAWTYLSY